jgi:hypothetical protein
MQSFFRQDRFRTLDKASRELRDAVRDLVSGPMRASERAEVERIEKKRTAQPDTRGLSAERERVIVDILVAREMVRVDLGVDLLLAQPSD